MRTSRVSQDTARLINALSSRRKTRSSTGALNGEDEGREITPTRSGAREARTDQSMNGATSDVKVEADSDTDSSLSQIPSDLESTASLGPAPTSTRKRKRTTATTASGTTPSKDANGAARSSIPANNTTVSSTPSRKGLITAKPSTAPPSSFPRKPRRQPAKRIKPSPSTNLPSDPSELTPMAPPPNWEKVYTLTQEMRKLWPAPVDTMGCESLAETNVPPAVQRFQTLVSLMLSSQTKDTVTASAMSRLQTELHGGLTIPSILAADPAVLDELIGKVGFHNTKTRHLQLTARILLDRFSGDIPATIPDLVSLPGVGPKMAYLTMSAAWGRDEGIGVDVHVHRITNLWGWHRTRTPEETRKSLEAWLPRERWHGINTLLVGFGQTWCPPVGRRCGECKLAGEGVCPSAIVDRSVKREKRGRVKVEVDVGGVVGVKEEDVGERVIVEEVAVNEEEVVGRGGKAELPLPDDIEDIGVPVRLSRARKGRIKLEE